MQVFERGIPEVLKEIHQRMKGPVYVSVDIDAADPAYAPGTGTPEVGGFTSYQMLQLVRGLRGLNFWRGFQGLRGLNFGTDFTDYADF